MFKKSVGAALAGVLLALAAGSAMAAPDAETQGQIDALKAAIPKFAIPMREVGDRFQNMYFAAKGGNWALAAYMSKYMNGAMNPAKLTKPDEYKTWKNFYEGRFATVEDDPGEGSGRLRGGIHQGHRRLQQLSQKDGLRFHQGRQTEGSR